MWFGPHRTQVTEWENKLTKVITVFIAETEKIISITHVSINALISY